MSKTERFNRSVLAFMNLALCNPKTRLSFYIILLLLNQIFYRALLLTNK